MHGAAGAGKEPSPLCATAIGLIMNLDSRPDEQALRDPVHDVVRTGLPSAISRKVVPGLPQAVGGTGLQLQRLARLSAAAAAA